MAQTNLGILTLDCGLRVQSWDPWLVRATGVPVAEALGKHIGDLSLDFESRGLPEYFKRSVVESVCGFLAPPFHHLLFHCEPARPSRRFAQMQQKITIAPLKEETNTVGLIVTVEDITGRLEREHDSVLIESFGSENWNVRRDAVADLSSRGAEEAVTNLFRVLREQHRNLSVLNSALRVLTGSGLDTLSPLVALLRDPDDELRMYAALALGDLKNRKAVPALIEMLKDPNSNVRYHAIEALAKIRSPEAAEEL